MSPTELASAGAHPWIVNIAFLSVAVIGVWATWKRTISQIPSPKPRAEIAIGDAAILDGAHIRKGADAIGEAAKGIAQCAVDIRRIAEAVIIMAEATQRREEREETEEREELMRRIGQLENRLEQSGHAIPPHPYRPNRQKR